ncbi:MAG: LptA/OstA family protein [Pseudomonadota bacterium]
MTQLRLMALAPLFFVGTALAQETQVAFGDAPQDIDAPVEITSDQLDVDQEAGTALFTVDVVVIQGDMRLTAPRVLVLYNETQTAIDRVEATGGVTLVSGPDEAEAERADYTITDGTIEMTGDVLLNQGLSSASSERLVVKLNEGTATLTGRVRTILQTGGDQ